MSTALHEHSLGLTWVERGGTVRSGHALVAEGRVWLVDPFEDAVALDRARELGEPAGVIQLLDRHNRDCAGLASRLGVPHLRLPSGAVAGSPFEAFDVIRGRLWNEVALWWAAERTLIVAEAVGTVPVFTVGRRLGMHPLARLRPPRAALSSRRPERLLVGHGAPLETGAAEAIDEALTHARSDVPKLLMTFPLLLRR